MKELKITDMFGTPVKPGDKIIFGKLRSSTRGTPVRSELMTGVIDHFGNHFGDTVVCVKHGNGEYRLTSRYFLKYDWKEKKE